MVGSLGNWLRARPCFDRGQRYVVGTIYVGLGGAELGGMSEGGNADVVTIGDIPIEAFGEWPGLMTRNAVVTEERRQHILERHPDVALDLDELVTTVNDPDEAHRYPSLDVVELFRWDGWSHAWTVVIRVASVNGLSNSALTFHRMRRERVIKRRERADSVWERG